VASLAFHQIVQLAYVFDLAPQQDSNLRTRLRSAIPHTPATSTNAIRASCAGAAHGTRTVVLSFAICRLDSHDPEAMRSTNDHTCRSRAWHGCHAG
jgi:hypothetical protein